MQGLNKIYLLGNIGNDPELSHTQGGVALLKLRLAVNERIKKGDEWTEIASWFTVIIWNKRAEALAKLLHKGAGVMVEGSMRARSYEDRDGNTRESFDVHANEVILLPKGGGDHQERAAPRSEPRNSEPRQPPPQQQQRGGGSGSGARGGRW